MLTANIRTIKKCALCKYWYDPTNSAISPRFPKINLWQYDDTARMKCLQKITKERIRGGLNKREFLFVQYFDCLCLVVFSELFQKLTAADQVPAYGD